MKIISELIPSVSIPEGKKGDYEIKKKTFGDDSFLAARMARDGRNYIPGTYTFLYRGGTLVMSDTPDEKNDHRTAVNNAEGNCLIAGLGIGMVLNAIAQKEVVTHIDVVELSQEVIDLVAPFYERLHPDKITFHCDSIFDWKWDKDVYYNMAWFDIWDTLDEDNLPEMAKLHRRFGKRAAWKGSWGKEILLYNRQRNKRHGW